MGDIAEAVVDGMLCQTCGVFLDGGSPGHPRWCEDCAPDDADELLVYKDDDTT